MYRLRNALQVTAVATEEEEENAKSPAAMADTERMNSEEWAEIKPNDESGPIELSETEVADV